MKEKSNIFNFNLEWYEVLKDEPAEIRFEVYEAIMEYATSGTLPELKPRASMAMKFICMEIDAQREAEESQAESRREAGRLSGLAKANNAKQDVANVAPLSKRSNAKQDVAKLANASKSSTATSATKGSNFDKNIISKDNIIADDIIKEKIYKKEKEPTSDVEQAFEDFRQMYPGTKRGFKVELDNFKRKHPKDWQEIVPLLGPAIARQIEWTKTKQAAGKFAPEYKNLSTWINQQCWTEEFPTLENASPAQLPDTPLPKNNDYDVVLDVLRSKN